MLQVDARAHPDRRSDTGCKVHASGVPFDDTSGVRLRQWMGISREQFYDPQILAILPLGFCCPQFRRVRVSHASGSGSARRARVQRSGTEWKSVAVGPKPTISPMRTIGGSRFAMDLLGYCILPG